MAKAMRDTALMVRGGNLLDPLTGSAIRADIRTRNDRIVDVGRLDPEPGERQLDVTGLTVTCGFIDTHTHADCVGLLGNEEEALALANLRQGVTTQVCGNCGYSPFPVDSSSEIMGFLVPALGPGTQTFSSIDAWKLATEGRLPTNLAPLVGHGTLRAATMGFEDRAATEEEAMRMATLLEDALESGAFGLSSGLIYAPGLFAGTDELVALAAVAARFGTPYASHIRNETDHVEEAVAEAIEIGRRSGAAVHISHHKVAGRAAWGRTSRTLAQIDAARQAGVDVTVDVYPYTAGSTALQALLPPWVLAGGTGEMLERLKQAPTRMRLRHEIVRSDAWQNLVRATGWDHITVAAAPGRPQDEGKSLATIAAGERRDPVDVVCDLLLAERANVTIVLHMMDAEDVENVLRWPHAMIGSDGILQPGRPHPRLAGTFARVLGTYARDQELWPLEEAVRRMTSLPAHRFGLTDRGRISPGAGADLVAFDPKRVRDTATYERPLQLPDGVAYVVVNGVVAIDNGSFTGHNAGRVLRRG